MDALNLSKYLVLAWIQPGAGGNNNGRIFTRSTNAAGGPVGHMQMLVGNGLNGTRSQNFTGRQLHSTTVPVVVSGAVIPNGDWSCVGFTYDDTAGGTKMRMFEAGAEITPAASQNASGTMDQLDGNPVYIGNSGAADRAYQGSIAYIGIWNVDGLTSGQIDAIVTAFYNSGSGTADVPSITILVEFLRLDANGATTGDLGVLTSPTVTGAAFTTSGPPVEYNALVPPAPLPQLGVYDPHLVGNAWF